MKLLVLIMANAVIYSLLLYQRTLTEPHCIYADPLSKSTPSFSHLSQTSLHMKQFSSFQPMETI